mmetsp:Transcript_14378/g.30349  ORF Transcript_14378/g.30349 Transcript_14378/m.30349 type:complete len:98 (-) Transcript_14378:228-521(-)
MAHSMVTCPTSASMARLIWLDDHGSASSSRSTSSNQSREDSCSTGLENLDAPAFVCTTCNTSIEPGAEVYMGFDLPFCSVHCRQHAMTYGVGKRLRA